jgi:hypothetical protein
MEFLAEELGFESLELTIEWLDKQGCDTAGAFIRPAEQTELSAWKLDTAKALPVFHAARAVAFKNIDIKGQL